MNQTIQKFDLSQIVPCIPTSKDKNFVKLCSHLQKQDWSLFKINDLNSNIQLEKIKSSFNEESKKVSNDLNKTNEVMFQAKLFQNDQQKFPQKFTKIVKTEPSPPQKKQVQIVRNNSNNHSNMKKQKSVIKTSQQLQFQQIQCFTQLEFKLKMLQKFVNYLDNQVINKNLLQSPYITTPIKSLKKSVNSSFHESPTKLRSSSEKTIQNMSKIRQSSEKYLKNDNQQFFKKIYNQPLKQYIVPKPPSRFMIPMKCPKNNQPNQSINCLTDRIQNQSKSSFKLDKIGPISQRFQDSKKHLNKNSIQIKQKCKTDADKLIHEIQSNYDNPIQLLKLKQKLNILKQLVL